MAESYGVPGRGPDPRAVRSRAGALDAARALLVERGLPGVTHAAVAARSGIGRSTLYRHWPRPAALIRDAIVQQMSVAHTVPKGQMRADLLAELEASREMLHDPGSDRALRIVIERASVDAEFTEAKEVLYREGTRVLREIVTAAKDRGELSPGLDAERAVDQLVGPLMFRRLVANREFTRTYVREVVDDFLRAHGR